MAVASVRRASHAWLTARVLVETAGIVAGLVAATVLLFQAGSVAWVVPAVLQGFWFQRLYVVGHEAAHRKLLPAVPWLNDLLGQTALLPIGVPLRIFRQIHAFHHGCNRLDYHTSALEVFVVPRGAGPLRRATCWLVWYAAVFAGGWFLHSLISIVLFLFLPLPVARRVSPAFRGWRLRDQVASILWFGAAVAAHVGFGLWLGGGGAWAAALGVPFLVFAWVYSAQSYIYHYATTRGPAVRFHVRPLRGGPLVRWWLLNLNEHDVHHGDPSITWYELPHRRTPLPPEHVIPGDPTTFLGGVLYQLRGPEIVERP
jgi:fatty acid desaturase